MAGTAEFGPEWPLWNFKVSPEQVLDRMADPREGLIMVETGVDVYPVLDYVDRSVHKWVKDRRSEETYISFGRTLSIKCTHVLDAAQVAVDEIMQPLNHHLAKPNARLSNGGILITAARRQQQIGHGDTSVATAWLGATRPALWVRSNRAGWLEVDGVPAGHALFWRGTQAQLNSLDLLPIRHSAVYRSVIRRVAMLAG